MMCQVIFEPWDKDHFTGPEGFLHTFAFVMINAPEMMVIISLTG